MGKVDSGCFQSVEAAHAYNIRTWELEAGQSMSSLAIQEDPVSIIKTNKQTPPYKMILFRLSLMSSPGLIPIGWIQSL